MQSLRGNSVHDVRSVAAASTRAPRVVVLPLPGVASSSGREGAAEASAQRHWSLQCARVVVHSLSTWAPCCWACRAATGTGERRTARSTRRSSSAPSGGRHERCCHPRPSEQEQPSKPMCVLGPAHCTVREPLTVRHLLPPAPQVASASSQPSGARQLREHRGLQARARRQRSAGPHHQHHGQHGRRQRQWPAAPRRRHRLVPPR